VNNFKWGIMAAIAAAVISIGLGLIAGVNILHVFLRGLIFAAVFFGLGFGLHFLINSFFPELLFIGEESSPQESFDQPGARVNIIMDNTGEYAVPELYKTPGDPNELGNIDDLISGLFRPRSAYDDQQPQEGNFQAGIDRKREESYNKGGLSFPDQEDFGFQEMDAFETVQVEKPRIEKPVFTPSFGDDTGVGGLPDLEMFAMAFSSGGESRAPMVSTGGSSAGGSSVGSTPVPVEQDDFEPVQPKPPRYATGKPTPMKGDFNPKELAKGISTVLSKDK